MRYWYPLLMFLAAISLTYLLVTVPWVLEVLSK